MSRRRLPDVIRLTSSSSSISRACARALRSIVAAALATSTARDAGAPEEMGPAQDRAERRAQFVRQGGEKLVLHAARALRLDTRFALGDEERLALGLELLLQRDVERHAIESRRLALGVAIDAALRAQPAVRAAWRDGAVFDVVQASPGDRRLDRRPHLVAIVLVDERIEQVEVDLGVGRQPEVLLALGVPLDERERPRAVERAELAGVDRHLERFVGAAGLGVGDALGDARLFLLDQVASRLVLAIATAQRRTRRADERVGIERPLEQDDVAELRQRAARGARPPAGASRDEDDEGKVRPRRLVRHPVDQRLGCRRGQRFLGDEDDPCARAQCHDQLGEGGADLGPHPLRLQHLGDDERIAPAGRMDQDALLGGRRRRGAHAESSVIIFVDPT